MAFDYADCEWPIPDRISEAHRRSWRRLAEPGFWWTGAERVAIAAEMRRAAALESGTCSDLLPEAAIHAVEKIVVDNANLSREWCAEICAATGMSDARYIEMLGVLVHIFSIDELHRTLGIALEPLPAPIAGEPSRRRPSGARQGPGWLAITPPDALDPEDAELYAGAPIAANVLTALSLVPSNLPWLADLSHAHYASYIEMRERGKVREISRAQQELIAARVSVLNQCFY